MRRPARASSPTSSPTTGFEQGEAVQLETRDGYAIAWLDRPPANSLSPQVIAELGRIWEHVDADDSIRALILASANPMLFCAGADIKAFTKMDEQTGAALMHETHALLRRMEPSSTVTIAAVNAVALGGGCELAMAATCGSRRSRRASASPRSTSGSSPASAARSGCRGWSGRRGRSSSTSPAIRSPPPRRSRSGWSTASCPTTSCTTSRGRGRASSAARRRSRSAAIKRTTAGDADLDEGIEAEKAAFGEIFATCGRARGDRRVPRQARGAVDGEVAARSDVAALAQLIRGAGSVVALTGAGISVPSGIPDFRSPGTGIWKNVDPMEVAHIDAWREDPERFWSFYGHRFQTLGDKEPNGAHRALVSSSAAGCSTRSSRRTSTCCTAGRDAGADRGARVDRVVLVPVLRRARRVG